MVEASQRAQWDHTASLMAHMVNIHPFRKKKARPISPTTYHPYYQRRRKGDRISVARLTDEIMAIAERKKKGR